MATIRALAGFLDSKSGQIRDRAELAKLDAKIQNGTIEADDATEISAENEKSIKNALGQVRSRTYEQISSASSATRAALDDLKAAKQQSKKEVATLKALESALQSGDTEKVASLKEEFNNLQAERKILAQKIGENNSERSGSSVRFGNKELAKTSSPKIEFADELGPVNLDNVSDIRRLRREEINPERKELNSKQKELNQDLSNLKSSLTELDGQIGQLLKNDDSSKQDFTRDLDSINKLTNTSALAITKAGSQAELAHAISSNSLRLLS